MTAVWGKRRACRFCTNNLDFADVIASGFDVDVLPDTWLTVAGASEGFTVEAGEIFPEAKEEPDMSRALAMGFGSLLFVNEFGREDGVI
ncbi:hypothetical protein ACLMJK_003702 [Lecanora helva]